jgi:hypothetical protein
MHFNHGIGVNFVNIFPRTPSPILPLRVGDIGMGYSKLKDSLGCRGKKAGGRGWLDNVGMSKLTKLKYTVVQQ